MAATSQPGFQGQVTVLIVTRGRPEMLAEVFASLRDNTVRKDKTALWLYVDDDDSVTLGAIERKEFPDPGFPVHWNIGIRTGNIAACFDILVAKSGGASDVYMTAVDDARFDTSGWDEIIRDKFKDYPDGILLSFAHDPMTTDSATYVIFGRMWVKILGSVFPPYFPHWFPDTWVDEVGRMAGRLAKLPVVMYPIRGKGRTKLMRNLPFWARFFQLTLDEREAAARKLVDAINPNDEAQRAAAIATLEKIAAELRAKGDQFSDIYCAFQEERHAELSIEDRAKFNPKYFQYEAAAVARLITLAREAMERKKFDEAMTYLDATQLSDLRVKQAQVLKAECLRGVGRDAEARRIESELIAAWPQMNLLRRTFRFLGMVANDGKRMLVGLTKGKKG